MEKEIKKPVVYYDSYKIKCPFCDSMFRDQNENRLIEDDLTIDIYDIVDNGQASKIEDIVCSECGGVVEIQVDAEMADIEYTYYLTEKTPPTGEEEKDVPGQMFLWNDINPEEVKLQSKKK